MYLHPCVSVYTDERVADAGPPHTLPRASSVRARARARAIWRPRIRADTCERVPSAWTVCGFGAQVFKMTAFNANIGAWNTARVSNMVSVCTAFLAQLRATTGGSHSAGLPCGKGRCARPYRRGARARVCADVWARP